MPLPVAVLRTVAGISFVVSVFAPVSPAAVVTEIFPPTAAPLADAAAMGISFKLDSGFRFMPCSPGEKKSCPPLPCTAKTRLLLGVAVAVAAGDAVVELFTTLLFAVLVICLLATSTFLAKRGPISSVLGAVVMPLVEVVPLLLVLLANRNSWLPIMTV